MVSVNEFQSILNTNQKRNENKTGYSSYPVRIFPHCHRSIFNQFLRPHKFLQLFNFVAILKRRLFVKFQYSRWDALVVLYEHFMIFCDFFGRFFLKFGQRTYWNGGHVWNVKPLCTSTHDGLFLDIVWFQLMQSFLMRCADNTEVRRTTLF